MRVAAQDRAEAVVAMVAAEATVGVEMNTVVNSTRSAPPSVAWVQRFVRVAEMFLRVAAAAAKAASPMWQRSAG